MTPEAGANASIEAPVPVAPRLTGWIRVGVAERRAQSVSGYFGMGAAQRGTFSGRPDDQLGIAIAHAIIGSPAVNTLGLPHAETAFEATYQVKLSDRIEVQPDFQYIHHPAAGLAKAPDAFGIGLRIILSTGFPTKPQADDPADPTVPSDGAPTTSPEDGHASNKSPAPPL